MGVFAQAGEHGAEGRVDQPPHQEPAAEQDRQAIEEGGPAEEIEPEGAEDRRHHHPREAVGAAREPGRLVGDLEDDRSNSEGEHEQREGARAQDHCARQRAEQSRRRARCGHLHERVGDAELGAEDAGGVRAEPEERAVPERDDAGVAEDQVERQREQDVDQDARAQREVLRQQVKRCQRRDPRQPFRPADARVDGVAAGMHHARAPNRPCGRHSRMAIVAA